MMSKIKSIIKILSCASLIFMLSRCATTSSIQKGILSSNDSLRSEAYYAFERNLSAEKQLRVISKSIEIAKYGKPDESLNAFIFLSKSEYSRVLSGNYCWDTETQVSKKCTRLIEELRDLNDNCIGRYLSAIDDGPYETQVFCIEVLGNARPIYVSTIEKLMHLLNKTQSETKPVVNHSSNMWMVEPVNYYAYWALKRIRTIETLEAAAKYDSVFIRK